MPEKDNKSKASQASSSEMGGVPSLNMMKSKVLVVVKNAELARGR
jgi:hypothetical protein